MRIIAVALAVWVSAGGALAQSHEFISNSATGNTIHFLSGSPAPGTVQPTSNTTNLNMVQGNGPVMRNPINYLIFWQPPGRAAFPAGYQTAMETFFQNVGGTPFYNIVTQYNDKSGNPAPTNSTSWGGSWVDTANIGASGCNGTPTGAVGATPNCPLTDGDLQSEVNKAIAANPGWAPASDSVEYFVFTPSNVGECAGTDGTGKAACFAIKGGVGPNEDADFCGYHTLFGAKIYAFIPFAGNGNCTTRSTFPNDANADIALSVVSHEMFESNTDPHINGWKGPGGNDDEIGDKCAYKYGFVAPDGTNLVLKGSRYAMQTEWSNGITGCDKRFGPAPTLSIPAPVNFGGVPVGTTASQNLNITNSGTGDADILYIRLGSGSDAAFSLTNVPPTWATLPTSDNRAVNISFAAGLVPRSAAGTVIVDTDQTPCDSGDTCTTSSNEIVDPLAATVVPSTGGGSAPVITKSFVGPKVIPGGSTTLSLSILNPGSTALSGVAFTDSLPAGVVVGTPNGLTNTCGGVATATAGSGTVSLSGGTIAGSATCAVTVTVTGTTEGIFVNSVQVTSTNGGTGNISSATLFVATPPTLSKTFGEVSIGVGNTTSLSFTLANPNRVLTLNALQFSDTLPAGLIVATPNGLAGACDSGTITAVAGSNLITLSNAALAPQASCTFKVNVTSPGTALGYVTNTTSTVTSTEALPGAAASARLFIGNPFQVSYAANLAAGHSFTDISNTGTLGAALPSGTTAAITGALCANVYAFTPDEQLVSCCSCPVTPNGLVSLSAKSDLASNTLTPAVPSALVIKLVATVPVAGSCNNSAAGVGTATLANGMASFETTLHATPAAGTFGVTETPFSAATLSAGELSRIGQLCNFILANGSGFGVCRSCRLGGLGADRQ